MTGSEIEYIQSFRSTDSFSTILAIAQLKISTNHSKFLAIVQFLDDSSSSLNPEIFIGFVIIAALFPNLDILSDVNVVS